MPHPQEEPKPPFCPFKYRLLGPFPAAGVHKPGSITMGMKAVQACCDKADCALWVRSSEVCSFRFLSMLPAIDKIGTKLCMVIDNLDSAVRDGIEIKKELLQFLKSEAKDVRENKEEKTDDPS